MNSLLLLAAGAATEKPEPVLLGMNAEYWVWTGITIFIVLAFWKFKAHAMITRALDAHIAEARRALDEAAQIRAEAEGLLGEAKAKLAAATKDAKDMMAHARSEAEALIAKAEADTGDLVARRERMANDKIAAAERSAVDAIKARAATGAVDVARAVIAQTHDASADASLVDTAIGAL